MMLSDLLNFYKEPVLLMYKYDYNYARIVAPSLELKAFFTHDK